jgi:enterochelin esterase-like enzyme
MKFYQYWASMLALLAMACWSQGACAQPAAPNGQAGGVTVERITVHGTHLEGNLEGDPVDRKVIVFLPPSYAKDPGRRYPVVYALHGYTIDNEIWTRDLQTPASIAAAFAAGTREMIVVFPDAQSLHSGSMYSSSVTIGDWEGFVASDLVAAIDARYRTIADRKSRGLMGHSMGGYGTVRIGMKHPEVFSSLYIMSPCCMSAREAPPPALNQALERLVAGGSRADAIKGDWMTRATLAVAAAWSPNPTAAPFFLDLPTRNGVVQPSVLARWAANAPLAMVDQYIGNLKRYDAIAMDVGDRDDLKVDAAQLHRILADSGVANSFEIYPGDHGSAITERFRTKALPFFGQTLRFGSTTAP